MDSAARTRSLGTFWPGAAGVQTRTWGASVGASEGALLVRGLPLVLLAARVEGAGVAPLPCTGSGSGSSEGACGHRRAESTGGPAIAAAARRGHMGGGQPLGQGCARVRVRAHAHVAHKHTCVHVT